MRYITCLVYAVYSDTVVFSMFWEGRHFGYNNKMDDTICETILDDII